jgi:hypothetical protein
VDFNRFLLPPEEAYGGANTWGLTLSTLAIAVWTMSF